ncbi:MAG: prephenate dehydrogenase [Cyclobacteriaceae bacterium]|nr:prephenate dehydrogenase [Cyclobacteriaceae bacterium]
MKISIVGVGLLGGSFALGLKSIENGHHFIGVDTNAAHGKLAKQLGIVDEMMHFTQAVKSSDLVVLATPVNVINRQLIEALNILPQKAILIDLGSTKSSFNNIVENHPKREQYISCHPIAGTENSGPEAAFAGLFKTKQLIICEKEKSNKAYLAKIVDIFKKLDMHITYMPSDEHDRHIAYVSHLSHISSFALGLTVLEKEKDEKSIFTMAGSGFSSTVRLAKSSPDMWAPILKQNASNVSCALDAYIKQLTKFKQIIDDGAEEQSHQMMEKANEIRRVLMGIEKG